MAPLPAAVHCVSKFYTFKVQILNTNTRLAI